MVPPVNRGRGKLLMVLTVKFDVLSGRLGGRRGGDVAAGEVRIHEGETAVRLARDFCQKYGLDEGEVALPLAEHIEVCAT